MIDDKLLLAHSVFSNKGAFAVLLGSGVSRPAGIPTAWEVLLQLINRLALLQSEEKPANPAEWYKNKYSVTPGYSMIIEQLTTTQEERVNLLKPFFEASEDEIAEGLKQPTPAHKAIARMVQQGYIRVIVTTNFDRLMENALRELGIEASVISNPNHIENVMPLIHSPITIIKINGDYLDTKFLNIESELSTYDSRLVEYLKYIFENFGLITCGWSAAWDIALKDIIRSSNKFRFGSYFTYLKEPQELQEIAFSRNGKLSQIKDADFFFKELLENIEALESGERSSPLSKPIAIARLKKYIAKPEFKIPLHELIHDISQDTFEIINNQDFPKPDEMLVKKQLEFQISRLDLLMSLLAQGIYWGAETHHNIWLLVISKHCHPVKRRTSWAMWSSLSYFSAFILFHIAGLTALYRKDYSFLKKLFAIEVFNPYREEEKINILGVLEPGEIITKEQLNAVFGDNKIVPHSELLHKYLKPHFASWLVDEKEFDELFDSYELLVALVHIQKFGQAYFPLGRFIYRRRSQTNIIYTKWKELEEKREELDWIREGLFRNFNELHSYYSYFNQHIKELRF